MKVYGKNTASHIVACEASNKTHLDRKNGQVVRHLCDIKACCNPTHLSFGTNKDNASDRDKNGHKGNYKVTEETAIRLRELHQGGRTITSLVKEFGYSRCTISRHVKTT